MPLPPYLRPALILAVLAACADDAPPPTGVRTLSAGVAFGAGHFVALRLQLDPGATEGRLAIDRSADGVTWIEVARVAERNRGVADVAWTGDRFIVTATDELDGAQARPTLVSTDGTSWTRIDDPPVSVTAVAGRGDVILAASDQGVHRLDGTSWGAPVAGTTTAWWSPHVEHVGDRFVVYGEGPAIAQTVDGRDWLFADTQLTQVGAIGVIDDAVVGFGLHDCCFGEEPDGLRHFRLRAVPTGWELAEVGGGSLWRAVRDVGDRAVAVDPERVATSDDGGVTWRTARAIRFQLDGAIATDGAGTVIVSGVEGAPLWSRDFGRTWDR